MKKYILSALVIVLLSLGFYFIISKSSQEEVVLDNSETITTESVSETETSQQEENQMMETQENKPSFVLGTSAGGNNIIAYNYGVGETELLFVGGTHGGYSWNTSKLSYELMDYIEKNPSVIPDNVKVTIIPVLNPDGLEKVTGKIGRFEASDVSTSETTKVAGRFNANGVDLNRNFDCVWQPEGIWQNTKVDGGDNAFSEPESASLKNYVEGSNPDAVVVFYSSTGGVFSSSCNNGVLAETSEITNVYAKASGYKAYNEFDFYEITGDMVNWIASKEIPAISILLTTHETTEFSKNKAGFEALLEFYSN